jgi:hypothetical protein
MVDLQGTVSWWDLAETAGLRAWAWGPVQNHGSYVGGPTLGGAAGVALNGSSQYISVPDHASLDLGNVWTLWCHMKRGPLGATGTLMSKGYGGYSLQVDLTGHLQVMVAGQAQVLRDPAVIDTSPHFVLATKQGGSVELWVDGVLRTSTTTATDGTGDTSWPLKLGADTASDGTTRDYFQGTLYGAAVFNAFRLGGGGPVILPELNAGQYLAIPSLMAAYRDPADATSLACPIGLYCLPGRAPAPAGVSWSAAVAGSPAGSVTLDGAGHGAFSLPMPTGGSAVGTLTLAAGATTWALPVTAGYALARLAPNMALGDGVANLADSWAMVPNPASLPDDGAVFYRAATGPNPTDYAPGSAWQPSAAAVQAGLPAVGAYIAAQVQLVRRS